MSKKKKLQDTFRDFTQQASQADADVRFLEDLRKRTGHPTVAGMVQRFQKLAGIKPPTKKK